MFEEHTSYPPNHIWSKAQIPGSRQKRWTKKELKAYRLAMIPKDKGIVGGSDAMEVRIYELHESNPSSAKDFVYELCKFRNRNAEPSDSAPKATA